MQVIKNEGNWRWGEYMRTMAPSSLFFCEMLNFIIFLFYLYFYIFSKIKYQEKNAHGRTYKMEIISNTRTFTVKSVKSLNLNL